MKKNINNPFIKDDNVYYIKKEDLKKCAKLMACSFYDDPSIRFLLGGIKEGKNDWKYFHTILKAVFNKCVMISNDENLNELLVLFPPSLKGIPTIKFLLNGGIILPFISKFGLFTRSIRYESNCNKIKRGFINNNTWYCFCFVVKPDLQHQGLGSHVMNYAIEKIDSINGNIYLETHKEINIKIYEHFGFKLMDTSKIPGTNTLQYAFFR